MIFPVGAVQRVAMPTDAQSLEIIAADGKSKLRGLHYEPRESNDGSRLILGFGGNGWNAIHTAQTLHELYPNDHVASFFYRGYPPSEGQAAADALLADASLVYDAAVKASGSDRVIAAGFSIGSGIAVNLAKERTLDGLILVTPFDRLGKVASEMFPFLPVGLVFAHEIDAEGAMRGLDVPTVIIAAGDDEIISAARTQGLRAVSHHVVLDRTIEGTGHNDIYGSHAFSEAMREGRVLIGQQAAK